MRSVKITVHGKIDPSTLKELEDYHAECPELGDFGQFVIEMAIWGVHELKKRR